MRTTRPVCRGSLFLVFLACVGCSSAKTANAPSGSVAKEASPLDAGIHPFRDLETSDAATDYDALEPDASCGFGGRIEIPDEVKKLKVRRQIVVWNT